MAVVLAVVWALAGIFIVEPAEEGVVLRFGQYLKTTDPGPHWTPYLIDRVEKVNVEQIRRAEIGFRSDAGNQTVKNESLMLTRDENIIDIQFAVQYRIKDARNYLFEIRDADTTLRDATESAVREVVRVLPRALGGESVRMRPALRPMPQVCLRVMPSPRRGGGGRAAEGREAPIDEEPARTRDDQRR